MLPYLSLMLLGYASLVSPSSGLKSIFILAGQSNMAGRGGVSNGTWDGVVPPECRPNPANILRLSAELRWEEAREPLHKDIDVNHTCGVGPGMAFANSVRANSNSSHGEVVVGLVPCAVGGTKISQWARGSNLYNKLVRRATAALKGDGGTIEAVLWYQGESDTVNSEDADSYRRRLEEFFTNLRADLKSPLLPIIQVAIAMDQVALASGEGPFIDKVREAQLGVALPKVKCVDAKGLQLKADHLHLTTSAQVQLAKMLANAFHQSNGEK